MNKEDKLRKIYDDFASDLKKITENTLSDFITDYIPHAETDLEMNVFSYSRQLIKDFLTDKPTYDWHYDVKDIFQELNSSQVREKMMIEYHTEIVNDAIKDKDEEIKRLKEQIKWLDGLVESYKRF